MVVGSRSVEDTVASVVGRYQLKNLATALSRADTSLLNGTASKHNFVWVNIDPQPKSVLATVPGSRVSGGRINIDIPDTWIASAVSPDHVTTMLALNYHELCHAWFTVGGNYHVASFHHLNMLEDQRIESMAVALYPALAPYFRTIFADIILKPKEVGNDPDANSVQLAYLLAAGRKFLSPKLRRELRKVFKHQSIVDEVDAIISEYRTLRPRAANATATLEHIDKCSTLANRLTRLLSAVGAPEEQGNHAADTGKRMDNDRSREAPTADKVKDMKEAGELIEQGADEQPDDEPDDTSEADSASGDGSAIDEASDEGSSEAGSGSSDEDQADDTDDGDSGGGDGGSGQESDDDGLSDDADAGTDTGGGVSGQKSRARTLRWDERQELEDLIAQEAIEAKNDAELKAEIGSYIATMSSTSRLPKDGNHMNPVSLGMAEQARQFSNSIRGLLSEDVDAGWDRMHPSGRVNVQRAMRGGDYDDLFDRWEPGHNDDFAIDAVVLADKSSSMMESIREVSKAMWVIRRGIESLEGGTVRTVAYNDSVQYIYDDAPVGNNWRSIPAEGSTVPVSALVDTRQWLIHQKTRSGKAHQIVFILTDGQWASQAECSSIIKDMMARGVAVILLGYRYYIPDAIPCTIKFNHITADQFKEVAQSTVRAVYERVATNIRR